MTHIKAFRAFRPQEHLAEKIASFPYDVINSEEARELRKGNDFSFLRINKPEVDITDMKDIHSPKVYLKGKENLDEFISNQWVFQDNQPCLYIYRQKMGAHEQTGLVCCSHIDDYFEDRIKKHEHTRPIKEKDRIDHMLTLKAHIGPVFLTYKPVDTIDQVLLQWTQKQRPVYHFQTSDQITHTAWVIDQKDVVEKIVALFQDHVPCTYVADGHHRTAASAKVGKELRESDPNPTTQKEYDYFLSVLFPSNQLHIIDYNRLIKDLNGLSSSAFMEKLKQYFHVQKVTSPHKPNQHYEYGMYLDNTWHRLQLKEDVIREINIDDPVDSLDISILSKHVISSILGIEDQRTSDRIDFVGGIRGLTELEKRVNSGEMRLAFSIFPVEIDQLLSVADAQKIMPPKSTWFEPKLRSGLFIHTF